MNLLTKYEDCRLNDTGVIDGKPFMMLQFWMTLTFDILTSKEIGVIYSPWQTFLSNMRTVCWTIHKLLTGNHLVYNSTEWPWPIDLKRNRGHLLTVTKHSTKHEDCRLNDRWVIDRKPLVYNSTEWPWYLTLTFDQLT